MPNMIRASVICFGIVLAAVWASPVLSEGYPQTLAEALDRHVRETTAADFDKHVEEWIKEKAKHIDRTLVWYDAYGKHDHLRERPQYEKYQVKSEVSDVKYKKSLQRTVDRPNSVYSQWFHNSQTKQPIVSEIKKTIKNTNVFTWTVQKNLNVGTSVSVWAGFPGFLDVNVNVTANLDLRKTTTETKTTEETFSIAYTLTVEPQTSVKADWRITEREFEIPWQAEIVLTGYIAAWFEPQYNEHWLWFYPVQHLQGGPFNWHPRGLKYTASGTFKAVVGIDSTVRTEEHPLMASSLRGGLEDIAASGSQPLRESATHLTRDGKVVKEL